jgi:hypothetical protein
VPEFVDVPELSFLMIDGHGDPNRSPRYQAAVEALYAVSYALKIAIKRAGGPDDRTAARLHPRAGVPDARQAPRDLPRRPAPGHRG